MKGFQFHFIGDPAPCALYDKVLFKVIKVYVEVSSLLKLIQTFKYDFHRNGIQWYSALRNIFFENINFQSYMRGYCLDLETSDIAMHCLKVENILFLCCVFWCLVFLASIRTFQRLFVTKVLLVETKNNIF